MWQPMGVPHVMLSLTSSRGSVCVDVSMALADVSIDSVNIDRVNAPRVHNQFPHTPLG
jgi:hypothetical protein